MRKARATASPSRPWPAVLFLILLTGAAFAPVKDADFVTYDDPDYVSGNQHVLRGLHPQGLIWALTTFEAANWHPLTWFSHMLDVSLFGPLAGPHHVMNAALHAVGAGLLFLLLQGLTGARWPSLFTAALFAVHPLRVESVAWISERKDVLSGLLGMLTLLSYLRYVKRPGPGRYALVCGVLALGLMAKPMLVTWPLVLLLLDWWPLGRLRRASSRGLILEKAPLLLLSAASAAVTYLAQQRGGAMASADVFSLAVRVNNACVSYVWYLKKMFWPSDLIPFYPHPGLVLTHPEVALSLGLLSGITALALAARARHPWIIAGWLWYLGTLVPVIGLVQVGIQGMADRYGYLPLIGLFLAISWEAGAGAKRTPQGRRLLRAGAGGVLITLTLLTWNQSRHWENTLTLFSRVVRIDPRNFLAYNMLGSNHLVLGEAAKARDLFSKALEIHPGYLPARYNLGLALAGNDEKEAALAQFTAVIHVNPRDAESLYNRGKLLLKKGSVAEALQDFDAARTLSPEQAQVHFSRGLALARLDRQGEAAATFEVAAALDPQNAEALYNLGLALAGMGRFEEAVVRYRAALDLNPGFAAAHNMLGVALAEQGRLPEALRHFEEAVRLDPSNDEARANLDKARGANMP